MACMHLSACKHGRRMHGGAAPKWQQRTHKTHARSTRMHARTWALSRRLRPASAAPPPAAPCGRRHRRRHARPLPRRRRRRRPCCLQAALGSRGSALRAPHTRNHITPQAQQRHVSVCVHAATGSGGMHNTATIVKAAAAGVTTPLCCLIGGGAAGAAAGDGVPKSSMVGVCPAAKEPGPDGVASSAPRPALRGAGGRAGRQGRPRVCP
jgi:hypothetical protein